MHIPDGFLDARTALVSGALATTGVALALRHLTRTLPERRVPALGLTAAFVFAAQMLNFPVAAGTSGHLVGATLAVVLVGPAGAVVVMTTVLVLQCLLFADGGLTTLGANVFDMALLAPMVAAGVLAVSSRLGGGRWPARLFGAAFGAWCSTVVAAVACAGQLALSGTVPWRAALPAMTLVHMLIGLGEAAITAFVLASLARLAPEWFAERGAPRGAAFGIGAGLLVCLGLALFVAPFASPWPDGLDHVAARLGFESSARAGLAANAPLAGYALPALPGGMSTGLAGAIGVIVAFAAAAALALALAPRAPRRPTPPSGGAAPGA